MADTEGIFARYSPYLDRYVQLGIASGRVISVSFPDEPDAEAAVDEDHELLDRIEAYLEGVPDEFDDVAVAFTVGGDERAILETAREIPYGEEVSVTELARLTPGLDPDAGSDVDGDGNSGDGGGGGGGGGGATLVRSVLAANPTPLLVPDHRVRDGASTAPPEVEQMLRQVEGL